MPPSKRQLHETKVEKPKRRRGETKVDKPKLDKALDSAISDNGTPELAILSLFNRYDFSLDDLGSLLLEKGLSVSFSKVKYSEIAPRVGLDPAAGGNDMKTFHIHRARIPTSLFKEIVEDLEVTMKQYGQPVQHSNEEARSRYLAPLFSRTIALFDLTIRNTPESVIRGCLTTSGRIEYHFLAFGGLSLLVIEVKYKLGTNGERLNAIAQVIAECYACDYTNDKAQFPPMVVHGILCDGTTFEFFSFDGKTKPPTFSQGVFPNASSSRPLQALVVADYRASTTIDFLKSLRPICETMFYLLLLTYKSGLQVYTKRSVDLAIERKCARPSTPCWKEALGFAEQVLKLAVDAATLAADTAATGSKDATAANELTKEALECLQNSLAAVPAAYKGDAELIRFWDETHLELC